jgi:hypothetical protein
MQKKHDTVLSEIEKCEFKNISGIIVIFILEIMENRRKDNLMKCRQGPEQAYMI